MGEPQKGNLEDLGLDAKMVKWMLKKQAGVTSTEIHLVLGGDKQQALADMAGSNTTIFSYGTNKHVTRLLPDKLT